LRKEQKQRFWKTYFKIHYKPSKIVGLGINKLHIQSETTTNEVIWSHPPSVGFNVHGSVETGFAKKGCGSKSTFLNY